MDWVEHVVNAYNEQEVVMGGLWKMEAGAVSRTTKGILYTVRRNPLNRESYTIIFRSEQKDGRWTTDISDVVEIIDGALSRDEAIRRCKEYAD